MTERGREYLLLVRGRVEEVLHVLQVVQRELEAVLVVAAAPLHVSAWGGGQR